LADRIVGRDLGGKQRRVAVAGGAELLARLGAERAERVRHEVAGLDRVARALLDHGRLELVDLERRGEGRRRRLADLALDGDRVRRSARVDGGRAEVGDRRFGRRLRLRVVPARAAGEQDGRHGGGGKSGDGAEAHDGNLYRWRPGTLHPPLLFLWLGWESRAWSARRAGIVMPCPEWIAEYPLQVTTEENAPQAE